MKKGEKVLAALAFALWMTAVICIKTHAEEPQLWGEQAARQAEAEMQNMDAGERRLQEKIAAWYNVNLRAEQPEPGFETTYGSILSMSDGVLGILEIPKICVCAPIYHGTDKETLEKGIGHLPASAFPLGGVGNHTALAGGADRAFVRWEELAAGDLIYIHVLGKLLVYEIREPSLSEDLEPVPGEDLCTLICRTQAGDRYLRAVRLETEELYTSEDP